MRLILVTLALIVFLNSALGCPLISEKEAETFINFANAAASNCEIHLLTEILAPDYKLQTASGIRDRAETIAVNRQFCAYPTPPRFEPRITSRKNDCTFIVELKVYKGPKLIFTSKDNVYELARPKNCPQKPKQCLVLKSGVFTFRLRQFAPFGSPRPM